MRGIFTCIPFLFIILAGSCKKDSGNIPVYIRVPSFTFSADSGQGSSANQLLDYWLYLDDQLIGAYEIPSRIPVITFSGAHSVKLRPGIKLNGITDARTTYPFYETRDTILNFEQGKITEYRPHFYYSSAAKFPVIEDFESDLKFKTTPRSSIQPVILTDPSKVFEGGKSLGIFITGSDQIFEMASLDTLVLPGGGKPVFIEMNYKANNAFTVGLMANGTSGSTQISVLNIFPSTGGDLEWKKIYINLTSTISAVQGAVSYNIFIGTIKDETVATPEILIDNIKVVHS